MYAMKAAVCTVLALLLASSTTVVEVEAFAGQLSPFVRRSISPPRISSVLQVQPQDFSAGKIGQALPFRGFPREPSAVEEEEEEEEEEEVVKEPAVVNSVTKAAPTPAPKPKPVPESKPEVKADPVPPTTKPEPPKAEPSPPEPKPSPEPKASGVAAPDPKTAPESTAKAEPTPKSEPEPTPAPKSDPTSEPAPKSEPPATKAEPKAEPAAAPSTGGNPAPSAPTVALPSPEPAPQVVPAAADLVVTSPASTEVSSNLISKIPLPLLAIPIAAIVAGRAILADREEKKREIDLEIFEAEQRKEQALKSSNNLVIVSVLDSPLRSRQQLRLTQFLTVFGIDRL
jgi:hypothetical protein